MRYLLTTLCLVFLTLTPISARTLSQKSTKLIQELEKKQHSHIGIMIQNKQTQKVEYQHNANQFFIPASIQKIFTASAAALYLKPNFHFKTNLLYTGFIKKQEIHGNLYIQFSGDPTLKNKHLVSLLNTLKKRGIKRIDGNIIIDNTAFNTIPYPPGIIWDNLSYSFSSPTTAIILNENKFILHFIPQKNKTKPKLVADLPLNTATFTNRIRSVSSHQKNCPITIYSNSQNQYLIGGCFNRNLGEQRRSLAIRNAEPVLTAILTNTLGRLHIPFNSISFGLHTPKTATLIATHPSQPLKKMIKKMLKQSDNLISNALLKTIGHYYYNQKGNWQTGLRALKQILSPVTGINFKHTRITDGAGLSRYNLIQPQQVIKLLDAIQKNPILKETILPALPIAGVDGTLAWRLTTLKKHHRLRAKTGTMTGVSNLAGFIHTRHHGNNVFVILINGFIEKPRQIERRVDRFLKSISLAKQ